MSLPEIMCSIKQLHYRHLLWIFLILPGCNIINPDEDVPCYIKVDSFTFSPSPTINEMGSSSSTKIRDVWVYVDFEFQGAYELPVRFPVLKTGVHQVTLSPGIILNGISSTRSPYPFYNAYTQEINLPANGELKMDPVVSYFDSVKCHFCEDFEGVGFSFTSTSTSDTVMYQLPAGDPNVKEGTGSGVVYLDSSNTRFEITSTSSYDLPGSGAAVYLEMDYKINQSMIAGLLLNIPGAPAQQVAVITLNPTETWNKIYVQLGYTVTAYPNAESFQIFFGAIKSNVVPKAEFYLDNIKVVSF